jgi:hypothetical protein
MHALRMFAGWLTRSTGLARELGTLSLWNFIVNRPPLQGILVLALISPGMFFVLNMGLRGAWLPFSYQWYTALFGDVLLAFLGGFLLLWIAQAKLDAPRYINARLFKNRLWHYVIVLFWYGVAALHVWQESGDVTTWERRLGANALYHNLVVYPLLGYALVVLTVAAFKSCRVAAHPVASCVWVAFGVSVLFSMWLWMVFYDSAHQLAPNGVSKHVYSSPEDGWHNIRLMIEWGIGLVR